MAQKLIYLEGIEPLDFYGVNNVRFNKLKEYFSDLKVVSKGSELRVEGDMDRIELLEEKVNLLLKFIAKFNHCTIDDFDEIMGGDARYKLESPGPEDEILLHGEKAKPIRAMTIHQKELVERIRKNDLVMAVGPAGTGKTYTAIAIAVSALKNREVKRIILTRPAVEAGEKLGYLPGDFAQKLDPYLQPLFDALRDMIPAKKLLQFVEDNTIQISPLAYMRGRTLDHAFVILDEGQNATISQFKMFLTRMGPNAKFIVTGDDTQVDLPGKMQSGLIQAIDILRNIDGISVIRFDSRDIIRHRLVKKIVKAYNNIDETKDNDN
ncbi:MAG: PhoH family protein [Bacteroidales bacterium]|nr:PhoH family protein [Bacteroidales bacterium]